MRGGDFKAQASEDADPESRDHILGRVPHLLATELCCLLVVTLSSPIYLKTAQNKTIFHVESSSAVTGRISMKKVISEVYIVTDLCS